MTRLRRAAALVLITIAGLSLTACEQWQVGYYLNEATPEQRTAIDQHNREQADLERQWYEAASRPPMDCYAAIDRYWPAESRGWARAIVKRESNNTTTAQNRSSSAAGCMQLLRLHAPRFSKLGYSWDRDRYDPSANIRVALDLYLEVGASPWSM